MFLQEVKSPKWLYYSFGLNVISKNVPIILCSTGWKADITTTPTLTNAIGNEGAIFANKISVILLVLMRAGSFLFLDLTFKAHFETYFSDKESNHMVVHLPGKIHLMLLGMDILWSQIGK